MNQLIIVGSTIILGFILLVQLNRNINQQISFISRMDSTSSIRQLLKSSFSGYMLCVDAVKDPRIRHKVSKIPSYMLTLKHKHLIVDGATTLIEDPKLLIELQIKNLPVMIAFKNGKVISKTSLASTHPSDILTEIRSFVEITESEIPQ